MSTSPIVITPSTSVVLVNTADFSGNPVVLLPNLTSAPGVIGRIITVRDNDGGSVNPTKSIYISTTGGARFQSELSTVTLSTIRITQPYGFVTLTPRLTDGSGNTNYGLMNVYAFPDASPAAYVNTLNANFSYLSTLSTVNLAVGQNAFIQGNLNVTGSINYTNPGSSAFNSGTVNANTISAATILNRTFNGVNIGASTINTSTFVVRDSGSILLPNASTWSNASAFAGTVDPNSLNLGVPSAGGGAQVGLSSNFFGLRAFTKDSSATTYSTTVVMRDRNVAINPASVAGIGVDGNPYSDYRLFVTGSTRMSNQGLNNNTVLLKQTGATGCNFEANEFGGTLGTFRMDTSSNITEGFFGSGTFLNQYKWMSATKAGSIEFFTGTSLTADTTSRMTIDNAGRVGIGRTPTTGYALDVSGGYGRIQNYINEAGLELLAGGTFSIRRTNGTNGDAQLFNFGTGSINFATNSTSGRMVIDGNGRVGIGKVPTPGYALDVSGNARIINSGSGSAALDFSAGGGTFSVIRQTGTNGNVDILNNGTGLLSFGNNGIPARFAIDASGRIGAGTITPNSLLNLAASTNLGDTSGTPLLCLQGGDFVTGRGNFWIQGGGFGQKMYIQSYLGGGSLSTTPSDILLNPYGGSVGIGTTNPSKNFDVSGDGRFFNGSIYEQQFTTQTATVTPALQLYNAPTKDRIELFTRLFAAGNYNSITDIGDKALIFSDNNNFNSNGGFVIAPHSGGISGIRITSNGTVGIGVTNPTTQLSLSNSATNAVSVVNSTSRFNVFGSDPTNGPFIGWASSTPLRFATMSDTGGGSFTERMRIDSAGRVGIGTSSPQALIDIFYGADSTGANSSNQLAFQWNGGGYRHYVRSRHFSGSSSSNAIEFFLNNSTTSNGSSAAGTGNTLGMSITGVGVGIGCNSPSYNLDVSGTARFTSGGVSRFEIGSNNLRSYDTNSSQLLSGRLCCAYAVLTDIGTFSFQGLNVASITDGGSGYYRINLSVNLRSDGLYTVVANGNGNQVNTCAVYNQTSNYFDLITIYNNIGFTANWTITDTYFAFVVFP